MEILEYFACGDQDHWLDEIKKSDWRAGQYLYKLLRDGKLKEFYGEKTRVFLLTENSELISFCTYAEKDEIPDTSLTPWVGFVYTFPQYRGKRRMGKLIEHIYALAKKEGHEYLYVSTSDTGIYENYGFTYWKNMADARGEECRIYRQRIESHDYSSIIGTTVSGTIDRPLHSALSG